MMPLAQVTDTPEQCAVPLTDIHMQNRFNQQRVNQRPVAMLVLLWFVVLLFNNTYVHVSTVPYEQITKSACVRLPEAQLGKQEHKSIKQVAYKVRWQHRLSVKKRYP